MGNLTFIIPRILRTSDLNDLMRNYTNIYNSATNKEKAIFDFTKCEKISPTCITYIAIWKDYLKDLNIETFYKKPNINVKRMLSNFGLFTNSDRESIAIKDYMVNLKKCMSIKHCREVHQEIISKIVIKNEIDKETYCAIDYMLNEIWDNAGVHGYECYETEVYPKPIYMDAICYKDRVEICVADRGQGIYNSLAKNKKEYKCIGAKELVSESLKNGVSGHPKGSPGFGLYCSSMFLKQSKGNLIIWSSGCQHQVDSISEKTRNSTFNIGTLISFTVYKSDIIPFSQILSDPIHGDRNPDDYIEEVIEGVFI